MISSILPNDTKSIEMSFNLSGKKIIVTGAGQGIGRDIVEKLHAEGAVIYAIDKAKNLLEELEVKFPTNVHTFCVDLENWNNTRNTIESIGLVDGVVNNAAYIKHGSLFEATEEDFDKIWKTNVVAVLNICQGMAEKMRQSEKGGCIVNISSNVVNVAGSRHSMYAASKAALERLTKSMALEWGQYGIRVNTVNPSVTNTDMMAANMKKDPEALAHFEKKTPLGRILEVDDWYCINDERMKGLSHENWSKFFPLEMDDSTEDFLQRCHDHSDNTFWQLWLATASAVLSWFLNPTSINGLLGRGSMHVFSTSQFQALINYDLSANNGALGSLLDIGAGDGETTQRMETCFHKVFVTEMSTPMKWSLEKRGYKVLNESDWHETAEKFDVVSVLNVLDRCDAPLTLLKNVKKVLGPEGMAIVSFVIPFNPYVEFDSTSHDPSETLPVKGPNFEEEVNNFIEQVLKPNGWSVVRWTRLPYLCEGDIKQAFYWLDDAVFLIRPIH